MAELFVHNDFLNSFMNYQNEIKGQKSREISPVPYGKGRYAVICPEPVTFISQLDDSSDSKTDSQSAFLRIAGGFPKISLEKQHSWLWFNTTKHGINLRPGLDVKNSRPLPKTLGDAAAHALMAGQTGSGKSVLLNNLIFNMLTEYPPWELDLYLADFKRVEFSRYMNDVFTPHICACAATGEVRYVLSLISYLVDCMNAREELFSRLGLTKIEAFRERFPELVLPRMLLIVDEFQQLFLEASPKEEGEIRRLLTAIVKKGRATGLHILFSSQDMSQTLSRSSLSNFRLRFALNCSAGTSMDVLGNTGAARIRRGSVLVNFSDGTEEQNEEFRVPYIETEETDGEISYFYDYLQQIAEFAKDTGFRKTQKFYIEELQEPFSRLETVLDSIREYRGTVLKDGRYFDVLTLGPYVTFSNLKYDIQTLFLETGRNKNILAVSSQIEDIAYLEKLFCANFASSPRRDAAGEPYVHEIYSFQPRIRRLFSLEDATGQHNVHANPEDLDALELKFTRQQMLYRLFQECRTPLEFARGNYRANLNLRRRDYSGRIGTGADEPVPVELESLFKDLSGLSMEDIPAFSERILAGGYPQAAKAISRNLTDFYIYRQNPYLVFPPTIYWIIGADSLERIPEWLKSAMRNGMDYNTLFILMASSEFDQMGELAKCCDYLFAGGNNSKIYDRLRMNYSYREPDSIVLDLYIKSTEEDRSFKKYKCSFGRTGSPEIPFDKILP